MDQDGYAFAGQGFLCFRTEKGVIGAGSQKPCQANSENGTGIYFHPFPPLNSSTTQYGGHFRGPPTDAKGGRGIIGQFLEKFLGLFRIARAVGQ